VPIYINQKAMRRDNDRDYGNYNRDFNREDNYNQNYNQYRNRHEPGEQYRAHDSGNYRSRGDYQGDREDYYNQMYDISNYTGVPRYEDYGLPHGPDDELMNMKPMPLQEGPYYGRRRFNYSLGYNPNFDNPEEGDMYRDFDSRGNHGYRHDASYGNEDEFRDFGNDHYGSYDRTNRPDYDEPRGYDRY